PALNVADCDYNVTEIIGYIKDSSRLGVKLLVFPELSITGYSCGDLIFQNTLLASTLAGLYRIIKASRSVDTVIIVGLPLVNNNRLYNCAAVIYSGTLLGVVPKSVIPNYIEFIEKRYFDEAPEKNGTITIDGAEYPFGTKLLFKCRNMPEFCIGVEICEDIWHPIPPSTYHAAAGATIIANLSASNEIIEKSEYRRLLIKSQSGKTNSGYVFANASDSESTTDLVFSSHNIIAENGTILTQTPLFDQNLLVSEIDVDKLCCERRRIAPFSNIRTEGYQTVYFDMTVTDTQLTRAIPKNPFVPDRISERDKRCVDILTIQSAGLAKRIKHTGCKKSIIGVSGGLDSCLALIVTTMAHKKLGIPVSDIVAISMPCFGTTERTKSNAQALCEELGVEFMTVDITESVKSHFNDIGQSATDFDTTFENAQARERTQVLMDIANKTGGIVIGTGDLSELALGFATYNGDQMSMYAVNSGVPKTIIRHIVKYYATLSDNENLKNILYDIVDTPISPELLPPDGDTIAQQTEDIVGPYELHDFFIYYMLRYGFSPAKIYYLALCTHTEYDDKTILKWQRLCYQRFFASQFKRSAMPDGPKVGSVALSPRGDLRMPSDACAEIWLKEIDNL
ncbi:MAG: NAD(+) synthase, partial [Monoglobales bacterium]